jgi:hypothetical protein
VLIIAHNPTKKNPLLNGLLPEQISEIGLK